MQMEIHIIRTDLAPPCIDWVIIINLRLLSATRHITYYTNWLKSEKTRKAKCLESKEN